MVLHRHHLRRLGEGRRLRGLGLHATCMYVGTDGFVHGGRVSTGLLPHQPITNAVAGTVRGPWGTVR